jgi:hypothetical protein
VQFKVDGANLGSEDQAAPYQIAWDTTTASNGTHTLTAIARDASNNTTTSSPVSVTVSNVNPNDPSVIGQWSQVYTWPLVGIHQILLPTGKVLTWEDENVNPPSSVLDPTTMTFTSVPYTAMDLFCTGHGLLPDGRVFIAGGHIANWVGTTGATIFDPSTQTWSAKTPMSFARWYPTVTALPDGRMLVLSGAINCEGCNATTPEVYDPATNSWTKLTNAAIELYLYPHAFVLPDGRVLVTGNYEVPSPARVLDLPSQTWTTVDPISVDGGSSAMYLPGKILKVGTTANSDPPYRNSVANAYVLDMNQSSPRWRQVASMNFPRTYMNLTLLPDGNVLVTGGGSVTDPFNTTAGVFAAEMWSPTTETFTKMASMQTRRVYHSTALLLPDGRVLVAGSGEFGSGSVNELNAEVYSPPYLFKGVRPTISSAPSVVQYGETFAVQTPDAARIAKVSLMRLGAVTHAFNESQSYLPLSFTQASGGLNVQAPISPNLAPPGPYMLFLVDSNGVPSVATFVKVPLATADSQPPSAPANLSASSPSAGIISLSWGAATDNVGVVSYNIHRGTSPGVVPTAANRVGQSATTGYTDTAFSASGTYYYVVTAQDAAGNVSGASNEAVVTATADTTAPSVSITTPNAGATVSGVTTVTATASDDVGVVRVQLLLDGAPLGSELTQPPYTMNWDTSTAPNGTHTLSAQARDAAGNQATAINLPVIVSNVVPVGLVASYSFNEGSGGTVNDSSGNGNTGSINGARWTQGKYGNALEFAPSSWVTVADSNTLDLSTGMTIEAWVFPTVTKTDWATLVIKERPAGLAYALYGSSPQNQPGAYMFTTSDQGLAGPSALPLNTWTHVAATYDGTTLRIFINGTEAASTFASGNIIVSGGALRMGGNNVWGEYFTGRIDEIRIYNRALTQAQIQNDMNTPLP